MTVKELIEALSKLNQDSEAFIYNGSFDCFEVITEVDEDEQGDVVLRVL